jgi:hypothetical protein
MGADQTHITILTIYPVCIKNITFGKKNRAYGSGGYWDPQIMQSRRFDMQEMDKLAYMA